VRAWVFKFPMGLEASETLADLSGLAGAVAIKGSFLKGSVTCSANTLQVLGRLPLWAEESVIVRRLC